MDRTPIGRGHSLTVITLGIAIMGLSQLPVMVPSSRTITLVAGALTVIIGIVELARSKRESDGRVGDIRTGDVSGQAVAIGHRASASVTQAEKPTVEATHIGQVALHDGAYRVEHEVRVVAPSFPPNLLEVAARNPHLTDLHIEGLDRSIDHHFGGEEDGLHEWQIPNPVGRYRIFVDTAAPTESYVGCYLDNQRVLVIGPDLKPTTDS